MEALLTTLEHEKKLQPPVYHDDDFSPSDVALALGKFVEALRRRLEQQQHQQQPVTPAAASSSSPSTHINADWLLAVCSQVPSVLGPERIAQAVIDASHLPAEAQQQAALFDALGESEQAMEVLFELASHLDEIRSIPASAIPSGSDAPQTTANDHSYDVVMDPDEQRRQQLRQQALDAAQIAAITKAEAASWAPSPAAGGATHTVTRASAVQAHKTAQKAQKKAAQALKKAREAGAIVDESDLMTMDHESNQQPDGVGGLMGMSQDQVWEMQQSLLPEGSRQYYDHQGLPTGTTREHEGNLERVIIPPAHRDEATLHPRLTIREAMDATEAVAFSGTNSLNPMQSTVYEVAFHTRLNMLVCAPTGAGYVIVMFVVFGWTIPRVSLPTEYTLLGILSDGPFSHWWYPLRSSFVYRKTNVAMLTIVAHLRNVGLIGGNRHDRATNATNSDVGQKIVYIAPMKALAQEVVEKFSTKLKPLGMVVKELTGDMQLTRAAAEAANILVTTPEKWDGM